MGNEVVQLGRSASRGDAQVESRRPGCDGCRELPTDGWGRFDNDGDEVVIDEDEDGGGKE